MSQSQSEGRRYDSGDSDRCTETGHTYHQFGLDLPPSIFTGDSSWFNSSDLSEELVELQALRDAGEPLTKEELAKRIYPKAFTTGETHFTDEYGKNFNQSYIVKKYYTSLVAERIRKWDKKINDKLDELSDEPSEQINYLRQVSLAIRVGEDDRGRVLLAYHGPDAPQSPQALEDYTTWAEGHQAKNGRLQKLAGHLYRSAVNPSGNQLDHSDIPGMDDTPFQDDLGLGA